MAADIPNAMSVVLQPIYIDNSPESSDSSSDNITDPESYTLVNMVTSIIESVIESEKLRNLENESEETPTATPTPYAVAIYTKFVFNFQFKSRSSLNASLTTTNPTLPSGDSLSSGDSTEISPTPAFDSDAYEAKQSTIEKYLNNMINTTHQIYNDLNQAQINMWIGLKGQLLTQLSHSDGVVLWNQRLHFWIFCTVIPNLKASIAATLVNDNTNSYPARICCPFDALGVGKVTRAPIEYEDFIPGAVVEMLVEEVLLHKSQILKKTVVSSETDSESTPHSLSSGLTFNTLRSGLRWVSLRRKEEILWESARSLENVSSDEIGEIDLYTMAEQQYQQTCKRQQFHFYLELSRS